MFNPGHDAGEQRYWKFQEAPVWINAAAFVVNKYGDLIAVGLGHLFGCRWLRETFSPVRQVVVVETPDSAARGRRVALAVLPGDSVRIGLVLIQTSDNNPVQVSLIVKHDGMTYSRKPSLSFLTRVVTLVDDTWHIQREIR
ncbi:hypothetical protein PG997_015141 [Apiospora hydei]|uniref:Uncharacterized protein n=1 Tax=Apiospora hydei TaxID=1337664 RepID=A0ABR1UVT9_9PEZI